MTPAQKIAQKHNDDLVGDAPKPGHNSGTSVNAYADRLEALKVQQLELAEDIRELKKEAKGNEIDPKALEGIVKRRMETEEQRAKREAYEAKLETYMHALGLI